MVLSTADALHPLRPRSAPQFVNFAFVPRHLRIPYVAAVSFGWTVILSVSGSSSLVLLLVASPKGPRRAGGQLVPGV